MAWLGISADTRRHVIMNEFNNGWMAGYDKGYKAGRAHQKDRIAELEAELAHANIESVDLENECQRLIAVIKDAWQRMDRAREILTDGNPSKYNNWGMLDTTLDRQALEKER